MKVAIRTDASRRIGSGHVVRCRTLADGLRRSGASVRFITRKHDLPTADRLRLASFDVSELPQAPKGSDSHDADYRAWLGVPQEQDAEESLDAIGEQGVDLLIVDHYGLDVTWESRLAQLAGRIMVIDDLANRPHAADILVDQNLRRDGSGVYRPLVSSTCRVLSGPSFALIKDHYARARLPVFAPAQAPRVFVSLGGTDDVDLLATILAGLRSLGSLIGPVDLVVTDSGLVRERLGDALAAVDVHLHDPLPHLADLMARADLAIGAGGVTTWERLCVGLPSLVVSRADNQRRSIEELASLGAIIDLGDASRLTANQLAQSTAGLLRSRERQRTMFELGQALVDGLGRRRVLEAVLPTPTHRLSIREVTPHDRGLLWLWANDRSVREQSLDPSPITWPEHVEWFERTYATGRCRMLILEADDLPVGQLRFDLEDGQATINYSLDIAVRGRGWGREIVARGLQWLRREMSDRQMELVAIVRRDNHASSRVFEQLRFEHEQSVIQGVPAQRFTRSLTS